MRWILASLIILTGHAWARAPAPPASPPPPDSAPNKTLEQRAGEMVDMLSRQIDRTADSIDIMLAGRKYTMKKNPSTVSVTEYYTHTEGGVNKISTNFGLNLRLPNVERRWQLRFSSYDEQQENRDLTQQLIHTRPTERDYGAAVLFFNKLGRIRTMFQPRVQLKNPLEVSYVMRFESDAKVGGFKVGPRVDLFADALKGTGQFFSLGFVYELNKHLNWVLDNTQEYDQRGNFFTTQHSVGLDYALKDDEGLGAAVTSVSTNRAHFHLDALTPSTTFTHVFAPDRLTFSFSPFIVFAESVHFKGNVGMTMALGLTI